MPDPISRVQRADHRQHLDAYDTSPLAERTDLPPSGPEADARAIAALTTSPPVPLALPPAGNRLDRVQEHTQALVETVKDWAELRIKLAQTELEQQVQKKVNQMVWTRAIPLILIGIAGLFLLVTVALGLGWWLGQNFWGFLIVTLLLIAAAGVIAYVKRDQLPSITDGADVDPEKTSTTNA